MSLYSSEETLDHLDKINIEYVRLNLDLIDFDKNYTCKKIKDISGKSPIPTNATVVSNKTLPGLVAMEDNSFDPNNIMLAIYFNGYLEFFRTSTVKNVTKKGNKILVETENSVYQLTEA